MPNIFRNTDHDQGAGRPNLSDSELREASSEYETERARGGVSRQTEDRYLHALDEVGQDQERDLDRTQRRMDMTGL